MKNQPRSLQKFEEMLWQQTLEQMRHRQISRKRNREEKITFCLKLVCEFPQLVLA